MERAVEKLIQCIDEAYTVDESEKEILRFGIQSAIELLINILISFVILYELHMIWEGLLFFVIFIPIRTLAGGYHLDSYIGCLLFSAATLVGIMVLSRYMEIPCGWSFVTILALEAVICRISPVVNSWRPVSKREYCTFSRRLRVVLLIDCILSVFFWRIQCIRAINIIMLSLMLILTTLVAGKIKYRSCQISI